MKEGVVNRFGWRRLRLTVACVYVVKNKDTKATPESALFELMVQYISVLHLVVVNKPVDRVRKHL